MKLRIYILVAFSLLMVGCAGFEPGKKEVSIRTDLNGHGQIISGKLYNNR